MASAIGRVAASAAGSASIVGGRTSQVSQLAWAEAWCFDPRSESTSPFRHDRVYSGVLRGTYVHIPDCADARSLCHRGLGQGSLSRPRGKPEMSCERSVFDRNEIEWRCLRALRRISSEEQQRQMSQVERPSKHARTSSDPLNASAEYEPSNPAMTAQPQRRLRLLVLCGLPGCGKSSLAEELIRQDGGSERWVRVSQDDLGSKEACVQRARLALLVEGRNVIVDRVNFNAAQRFIWLSLAASLVRGSTVSLPASASASGTQPSKKRRKRPARFLSQSEQSALRGGLPSSPLKIVAEAVYFDVSSEDCLSRVEQREYHPTLPGTITRGGGEAQGEGIAASGSSAGSKVGQVIQSFTHSLSPPLSSEGFAAVHVVRNQKITPADAAAQLLASLVPLPKGPEDPAEQAEEDALLSPWRAAYHEATQQPPVEHYQINLLEAFLLLTQSDPAPLRLWGSADTKPESLSAQEAWQLFCSALPRFPRLFAVYASLVARGWMVKSGLKYGGDFVLYDRQCLRTPVPPRGGRHHSEYVVLVVDAETCAVPPSEISDESTQPESSSSSSSSSSTDATRRQTFEELSWLRLHGALRMATSVKKRLVVCYVAQVGPVTGTDELRNLRLTFQTLRRIDAKDYAAKGEAKAGKSAS